MNNQEKREEISLYSYETNEKAVKEHLEYYLRHLKVKEYLKECTCLSFNEWLKQGGC